MKDRTTSDGIQRARVTLTPFDSSVEALNPSTTFTGRDGRFTFAEIPDGVYQLSADAEGYFKAYYGDPSSFRQRIELLASRAAPAVSLELSPLGTIEGFVRGDRREPLPYLVVTAFRRVPDLPSYVVARTSATDDRGHYLLFGLDPGDYVVGTTSTAVTIALEGTEDARAGAGMLFGNSLLRLPSVPTGTSYATVSSGGALLVRPSAFYGWSAYGREVEVVTVGPGEQRTGVDLVVRRVPGHTLNGVLRDLAGPVSGLRLELLHDVPLDSLMRSRGVLAAETTTGANGGFTFLGVPSGRYVLRARSRPTFAASNGRGDVVPTAQWLAMPISVPNSDLFGISASLSSGFSVRPRIALEGGRRPPPFSLAALRLRIRSVPFANTDSTDIMLESGSDGPPGPIELAPGHYILSVVGLARGWVLKSARYGQLPIDDSRFEVVNHEDELLLTFTAELSDISGTVQASEEHEFAGRNVILFPVDRSLWSPSNVRRLLVSAQGEFRGRIPSGEYYIAAISDSAFRRNGIDLRVLQDVSARARRVILVPDGRESMNLTISTLR